MEHSADLLTGTFLSVKEITFEAGFRDESHFVRDFKRIYGMTPTEYRKSTTNGNGHVSVRRTMATGPTQSQGKDQEPRKNGDAPKPKPKSARS